MSKISAAYAAGLFDGEGSISISQGKKYKRPLLSLHLEIGLCRPDVLYLLQQQFGGNICTGQHREFWRWSLQSTFAHKFLLEIQPYVVVKTRAIQIALNFRETTNPSGHRYTEESHLARQNMRSALMLENKRRGPGDLPSA